MNEDFIENVLDIVDGIPPGRVMSYGQVAAAFGSRSSRGVGRVMALYGSEVPWWRVVRAGGHPPTGHEAEARRHYLDESTPLLDTPAGYRISPSAFL